MSQNNPKYKRLESLLSEAKQVEPEPNQAPGDQGIQSAKTQIPEPDVTNASEAAVIKAAETSARPGPNEMELPPSQVTQAQPKPPSQVTELPVSLDTKPEAKSSAQEPFWKKITSFFQKRSPKVEDTGRPETVSARQQQLALWTAGIFALLGVVFFLFSFYNVFILQKGHFDSSDLVLTPVTILMVAAGLIGFILVRRGKVIRGLWWTFGVAIIPPILAVLVLGNVFAVALAYIVILALVMITWVFPSSERWKATLATIVAVFIIVAIELWNPAFRLNSSTLQAFAPYAIGLALIGLVAFFIRQAAIGSIRTKLITAFVLVALLSMGVVAYFSVQTMRATLTENIGGSLNTIARAKSVEIGQTIKREFDLLNSLAVSDAVRNAAAKASSENILSKDQIASLDQQWRNADAANNDTDPLVARVINAQLSTELRQFREQFPRHVEIFLTDRQGVSIASTNRTSDYLQADEGWWQTAYQNGVYIGQPEYDESSKTIAMNMAAAVRDPKTGEILGVLRTTVNFATLADSLIGGQFGQTGRTDVYLPAGQEISVDKQPDGTYQSVLEDADLDLSLLEKSVKPYVELLHENLASLASQSPVSISRTESDSRIISDLGWKVVTIQDKVEALQPVNTQTRNTIFLFVAISALIGVIAVFLARLITDPIVNLKTVAEKVASGDLNAEAKVTSRDEVGILASTFNNMTLQLKGLVGSLEQRVADRTHDLELASEVGRTVSEKVAHLEEMLTTAAELIRARFNLYYTQVYLTNPDGRLLLLRAGTGEVGEVLLKQAHRLTIDYNSLNGRAALEKRPVLVTDTKDSPNFKPNPLLPKTRSEMAIPLITGDRVIGVLDMQSEEPGALNEDTLPAFEALAGQLAIAIQNSELFAETERAREEIESQARNLTRAGWMDYLDAIHKPEQTSFVYFQNQIVTLHGSDAALAENPNAFSLPLEVSGETIGTINVEMEKAAWTDERKELVQSVSRQVAQQLDNLRLLETAERYRVEAESIMRRLTHEGWEAYTGSVEEGNLAYSYDMGKVVPLVDGSKKNGHQSLAVPLAVRDEAIGELAVDKTAYNEEAHEIMQAVAGQLSFHIENLRLSEQNERRAAELEAAVTRLRELDRLKSSFLANMSHELRTPLNSILGFADVILEELDGPLTETMQNDLGLIQKNGQHLLHLINDVLDMAKIEAGRMNLNPEKFRVHEILDEVTSITSTLASEKNLSLFIESDSDREVEIFADRTRLRQVMINLVNNSIKFTEKGKIMVRVTREANDHVLIRVKDTGIGIPVDKLEEVFTEFAQVDTSTTRKAGGTGLGLPISRKLIAMHGGRLWAESSGLEGEGSAFFVELPLEAQLTEPVEKLER